MTEIDILKSQLEAMRVEYDKYKTDTEAIIKKNSENETSLKDSLELQKRLEAENNIYRDFLNKGIIKTEETGKKQDNSLLDELYAEKEEE